MAAAMAGLVIERLRAAGKGAVGKALGLSKRAFASEIGDLIMHVLEQAEDATWLAWRAPRRESAEREDQIAALVVDVVFVHVGGPFFADRLRLAIPPLPDDEELRASLSALVRGALCMPYAAVHHAPPTWSTRAKRCRGAAGGDGRSSRRQRPGVCSLSPLGRTSLRRRRAPGSFSLAEC